MLADDHTFLVEAFRKLLEPQVRNRRYSFGRTRSTGVRSSAQSDVIVADIGMPLIERLEAGLRLKELIADHEADFPDDERGPPIWPWKRCAVARLAIF